MAFIREKTRGASGLTYGLLVGLISIVALVAVQSSGSSVNSLLTTTSDSLGSSIAAPSATPTPLPDAPTASISSTAPISVNFGDQVTLEGSATGEQVSLQWHLDGVPVAGATSDTLVISSLGQDDLGSYTLVATNPGGSSTSDSRTVSATISYTTHRIQTTPDNCSTPAFGNASVWPPAAANSFSGGAGVDGNGSTSVTITNGNFSFCSCYILSFGPVRVASVLTDVRFGVSTGGRQMRLRRANGSGFRTISGSSLNNTSNVNTTLSNSESGPLMDGLGICYNGRASSSSARNLIIDELRLNLAP
ncbi:MAG: hypothetical protein Alpg2KO_10670 [Alphaproteobacteria bacterium]